MTPEDIFSRVADWLDQMLIGCILIASTTRGFSSMSVEALNMVNITHKAFVSLMSCHIQEQPRNGCGVGCGTGRNNVALGCGKFPNCRLYLTSIQGVEPGWTGRMKNISALVCF